MNRRIEYLFETGQIGAGNIPFIDSLGQHGGYVIEVVGKLWIDLEAKYLLKRMR